SQEDRQSVVSQAESMQDTLQQSLNSAIENAYLKSGRVVALTSDVRIELKASTLGGQLETLALELLDRRFPTHPDFKKEAKLDDLQRLADWLVRAHEAGTTPVPFTDAEHPVLDFYGKGLEAVSIGQGRATLNSGSRFLKLVTRE